MGKICRARRRKHKVDERLVLNYRMINLKGRDNKQDLVVDYSIINDLDEIG
jgi:hypothetical protein